MAEPRRSEVWRSATGRRAIERELARLGKRLRDLRTEKGWTLERLAERASLHPVSLSRIENGHANVTIATLVALARALGVGVGELFEEDE